MDKLLFTVHTLQKFQRYNTGDLSHLPGDDDLLRLPIEINKGLFIHADTEQPIVIYIG